MHVLIAPTIGRKVWFYDSEGSPEQDATVIDVHGNRMVSLYVISRQGIPSSVRSVTLVQKGDLQPVGRYCAWMPYQTTQAAKHESRLSYPVSPTANHTE